MARMRFFGFTMVCLLAFAAQAFCGDKLINIQGKLSDSQNNPLSGNRTITFRLYNTSTDAVTARVWEDSMTVNFSSGLFNVALGQGANSLDSTPFNKPYYLGMQISGDANEMKPRQLLGASAYALGSLGDFNVKGKVGVGTTNPTTALEIMSDSYPQLLIRHKTLPNYGLFVSNLGGFDLYPGDSASTSTFKFSMAGNERMRISSDGTVQSRVSTFKFYMVPVGTVISYAGTTVPPGWLPCDGSAASRTVYADLFAAIGTTWGAGDGSTTFNLPDFRRRVAVGSGGAGTSMLASAVGSKGGEESHALTASEMPVHNHSASYSGNAVVRFVNLNPGTGSADGITDDNYSKNADRQVTYQTPVVPLPNISITYAGGNAAHNNIQPSAVVQMLIRY